jgi:tetratricopeptide (TPR) repeat protein
LYALLQLRQRDVYKKCLALSRLEEATSRGHGLPGDRIVLAQIYESLHNSFVRSFAVDLPGKTEFDILLARLKVDSNHPLTDEKRRTIGGVGDILQRADADANGQLNEDEQKVLATGLLDAAEDQVSQAARLDPSLPRINTVIEFQLRNSLGYKSEPWFTKFEEGLRELPKSSPEAIAQYLLLRLRHGTADKRCAHWFDKLEQEDRDRVRSLAIRARASAAAGQSVQARDLVEEQAEDILSRAKDDSERAKIYRGLGDIYLGLADPEHKAEDLRRAEEWFRRTMAIQPERFDLVASIVARQGRFAEVVQICGSAAKTDDTAKPAMVLASTLVEANAKAADLEAAEPLIAGALERFPQDYKLLYAAGLVRIVQNRNDEAKKLFERVLEINSKHIGSLNNLALLIAESGNRRDLEAAHKLIDRALTLSSDPNLFDTKGAICVYGDEAKEALKWLRQATTNPSRDPRFDFHLAAAYLKNKNETEAQHALQRALDANLNSQVLTEMDRELLKDLLSLLPKN